ncbi:hypothetical protein [Legionella waltersii]|uniref:Uncharacterized protein n=1 Tax=Legionella waltersii TaxID=66969 RepID=A0A0W1AD29_9GAMM|nr:hypothetical protein [Legionella waltersii]KTD79217.1 hypothetical protein Lwal_1289 [Legionella waltersii]SNV12570.1 Uncharacterised protein [Legionella waltersii]
MHRIFRSSNVDQCISTIEKFIIHANELGRSNKEAIGDLIAFFMKKPLPNSLLENNNDPKVASIKRMCRVMDSRVRMGLLLAIPEVCSKFGDDEADMPSILSEKDAAVHLISEFYHRLRNEPTNQMHFKMNDAWANIKTKSTETALLFCMQTFVPALIIEGDFPNEKRKIALFQEVLGALECKTTLVYTRNGITSKNPQGMTCFLKSMNIANRLSLTHGSFEDWTANDMQHFVQMVKSCPDLTHLSLAHMNIDACCKDEAKFKCILDLISLPQLHYLNLSGNHMNHLNKEQRQRLESAMSRSPIEVIQLRSTPEKIASSHRLFVSSKNVLGEKSKAADKTDEDVSLYTMLL